MKKLIYSLAAASFMLSGCTLIYWNEREYIIENGPRWAWEISIAKATKAECERLVEVNTLRRKNNNSYVAFTYKYTNNSQYSLIIKLF